MSVARTAGWALLLLGGAATASPPPLVIGPDTAIPTSGVVQPVESLGIAFDGTDYTLLWTDVRGPADAGIYGVFLDSTGALTGNDFAVTATHSGFPSAASDGGTVIAVWNDFRGGPNPDIYGEVLSHGVVPLPGGSRISRVDGGTQFVPVIQCRQGQCLVAWSGKQTLTAGAWEIWGARVDQGLSLFDPTDRNLWGNPAGEYFPRLAVSDGGYFLAWSQLLSANQFAQLASRLTSAGLPLDWDAGLTLEAINAVNRVRGAVAFDGTRNWAAWEDVLSVNPGIQLAWIDDTGRVTSLGAFGAAPATTSHRPALVFDGIRVWLAFEQDLVDGGQIEGLRFELDGGAAEAPFALSSLAPSATLPELATDGNGNALLAYATFPSASAPGTVHIRLLSEAAPDGGDAGLPDAGGADAGGADSGGFDAGVPDAGDDAGWPSISRPATYAVACGCGAVSPSAMAWAGLIALGALTRRLRPR